MPDLDPAHVEAVLCPDHADALRRWRRIWPNEDEDDFARRARDYRRQCRVCIEAREMDG